MRSPRSAIPLLALALFASPAAWCAEARAEAPASSKPAIAAWMGPSTEGRPEVSAPELEAGIAAGMERVPELKFLREEARRLGVRVWLFGGTAAGYAHYVKQDLQRLKGDPRFSERRFDYDYTHIYRSTQDLDLVVDGKPEAADGLERVLREKFPHLQGSKPAWEVRLLREKRGDKVPVLDNPDFLNQHTDSHSTGMIEVGPPNRGESIVRDLRDWNAGREGRVPQFLSDVAEGRLHYYFSKLHESTSRFRQGMNPPILSVIRYLTKAFQYELQVRDEDLVQVSRVIEAFNVKKRPSDYVKGWISRNGPKLVQHAVNIEYALKTLGELGLREKLMAIGGDADKVHSLAWYMDKEPLADRPLGTQGKTARQLGLTQVAHDTGDFLAFESITRSASGEPNVWISRKGKQGESAYYGEGFYTATGEVGARGRDWTIQFAVHPDARQGEDFLRPSQGMVIFSNKRALRVIARDINMSPVEFFEAVGRGELGVRDGQAGILERSRRSMQNRLRGATREELDEIAAIVQRNPTLELMREWFALPRSVEYPEILSPLLDLKSLLNTAEKLGRGHGTRSSDLFEHHLVERGLSPGMPLYEAARAELVRKLTEIPAEQKQKWLESARFALEHGGAVNHEFLKTWFYLPMSREYPELATAMLRKARWTCNTISPIVLEFDPKLPGTAELLRATGGLCEMEGINRFMRQIDGKIDWEKHAPYFEGYAKEAQPGVLSLLGPVLRDPGAIHHPEIVETLLERRGGDVVRENVFTNPAWGNPMEWVKLDFKRDYLAERVAPERWLKLPHWYTRPELMAEIYGLVSDPYRNRVLATLQDPPTARRTLQLLHEAGTLNAAHLIRVPNAGQVFADRALWSIALGGDHEAHLALVQSGVVPPTYAERLSWARTFATRGGIDPKTLRWILRYVAPADLPQVVSIVLQHATTKEAEDVLIRHFFGKPVSAGHPELLIDLMNRGTQSARTWDQVIRLDHWRQNPGLKELCRGAFLSPACLSDRYAFRGNACWLGFRRLIGK